MLEAVMRHIDRESLQNTAVVRDQLERQLLIAFLRDTPTADLEHTLIRLHDGPAGGGVSSTARRRSR
jgi:hypothetical protein